jgi:CubicO group peptidase (beta-lactamase class C family)
MRDVGVSRRTLAKVAVAAGTGALVGGAAAAPSQAATTGWTMTGTAVSALSSFDSAMKGFMQARGITAGQLAVTYKGRLVHARGYTNTVSEAPAVRPTSLFRIASLTKSLTAAAILRLVQDGKVSLGTPITSLLDLTPLAGQTADARLSTVTLWRLLQHTGGWDRSVSGDPNFKDRTIAQALGIGLPVAHQDVIRYMSGQPLNHAPGTTVAYSNFGYLLAGRVIEALSGLPYIKYVNDTLLDPLGIGRMAPAWNWVPLPTEVPYFSQYSGITVLDDSGDTVAAPYGTFNMRIQDANGGWLASAVDLVRWATAFDAAGVVLNSTSISRAFAVPETGVNADGWYRGLGWQVRPVTGGTGRNTWHTGSLPGTYSLLVRTYSGMSWAVVFNQRDDPSGLSYDAIDPLMWTAAQAVTSWPTGDQFPTYF